MKLLVGLGNPGREYSGTRHNSGYRVLDAFADISKIDIDRIDFHGEYGKGVIFGETVILLKPTTFMNLSGKSVIELASFFKIDIDDIVIIFDDMAINPGEIRLRLKGSSGGQKGMQNIIEAFGTEDIKRIRIGIGEPEYNAIDYVLGKPTGDEAILIDQAIAKACEALKEILKSGFEVAMSKFN